MKFLKLTLLAFTMIAGLTVSAQKIKLEDGSVDAIKSETTFNYEFTYDNMAVGKFDKEADYVKKKTDDYNAKDEGRGDG